MIHRVSVQETYDACFHDKTKNVDAVLIDVRERDEIAVVAARGSKPFPMSELDPTRFTSDSGIAPTQHLYIICRSGARSMRVAAALEANGFKNLYNVEGGTLAWQEAALPTV